MAEVVTLINTRSGEMVFLHVDPKTGGYFLLLGTPREVEEGMIRLRGMMYPVKGEDATVGAPIVRKNGVLVYVREMTLDYDFGLGATKAKVSVKMTCDKVKPPKVER